MTRSPTEFQKSAHRLRLLFTMSGHCRRGLGGSVREPFEAPTTTTNQFILQMTWPLKGKKLLDLASPLEDWDVGSNQFDLDCFGNTIHHVEDRAMLFEK